MQLISYCWMSHHCFKVIVARPLSIIFEKSQRSGDTPDDGKRVNVILIYMKGPKEDPGNYKSISHTSVPGKLMERSSRSS